MTNKKQPKSLKPRDWSKITEKIVKLTEKIPAKKVKTRRTKKGQTLEQILVDTLTDKISEIIDDQLTKNLFVNKARCTICGDIVESKSVHHLARCKCGRIFVDGGHDYQRTGVEKPTDIETWNEEEKKFKPLKVSE